MLLQYPIPQSIRHSEPFKKYGPLHEIHESYSPLHSAQFTEHSSQDSVVS